MKGRLKAGGLISSKVKTVPIKRVKVLQVVLVPKVRILLKVKVPVKAKLLRIARMLMVRKILLKAVVLLKIRMPIKIKPVHIDFYGIKRIKLGAYQVPDMILKKCQVSAVICVRHKNKIDLVIRITIY